MEVIQDFIVKFLPVAYKPLEELTEKFELVNKNASWQLSILVAIILVIMIATAIFVTGGEKFFVLFCEGFFFIIISLVIIMAKPLNTPENILKAYPLQIAVRKRGITFTSEEVKSFIDTIGTDDHELKVQGYRFIESKMSEEDYLILPVRKDDYDTTLAEFLSIEADNVESVEATIFNTNFSPEATKVQQLEELTLIYFAQVLQINFKDNTTLKYLLPIGHELPTVYMYSHPLDFGDNFIDEDITRSLTQADFSLLLNQGGLNYVNEFGETRTIQVDPKTTKFIESEDTNYTYLRHYLTGNRYPEFHYNIAKDSTSVDVNANINVSNDAENNKQQVDVGLDINVH